MIRQPEYYDKFHCLASQCHHCCCMGWQVEVDDTTYEMYQKAKGALGEELRSFVTPGKRKYLVFLNGQCQYLTKERLCGLYVKCGDDYLCETCRSYPRIEEPYSEEVFERVLTISCEEAGRLLFTQKDPIQFVTDHKIADELYLRVYKEFELLRERLICLIQDRRYGLYERMQGIFAYSNKVQDCLDAHSTEYLDLSAEDFIETKHLNGDNKLHTYACMRIDLLEKMDALSEDWKTELLKVRELFYKKEQQEDYLSACKTFDGKRSEYTYEYENLLVYLFFRYILSAGVDHRFFDRVRFCLFSCLIIHDMDCARFIRQNQNYTMEDRIDIARIYSRQIEHSTLNMAYLRKKIWRLDLFTYETFKSQLDIFLTYSNPSQLIK